MMPDEFSILFNFERHSEDTFNSNINNNNNIVWKACNVYYLFFFSSLSHFFSDFRQFEHEPTIHLTKSI